MPHLDLNGEPIEWLEDFRALIAAGVIPTDTIAEIKNKGGDVPAVTDPVIHDNMSRAGRAFRAVQAYAEDYDEEAQVLITDLINDLHHLADAYGTSWESALRVADANYTNEISSC